MKYSKYSKPVENRPSKYIPPRNNPPEHEWIRFILGLGTLLVLYIISQYLK